ncbi:MAG: hypothetical protein RLZZ416_305 [Candidatus Parcubacteria bacterium]|jgi:putative Holliday junction resolvase
MLSKHPENNAKSRITTPMRLFAILAFMKHLGIDYGTKRVGLAVSDPDGALAFPRETFPNDASLLERLAAYVEKEKIAVIVVGDARSFGGAENPVTKEADSFADALTNLVDVPVKRAMEVFSSVEASRYAPAGKTHDDAAAAAIILQRYLDGVQ